MDNFQQSELNISVRNMRNGVIQCDGDILDVRFDDCKLFRIRANAMTKDIEPFNSSLRSTAVAGEYVLAGEAVTRE